MRKLQITLSVLLWIFASTAFAQDNPTTITFSSWDTGEGGLRNEQIINQFMQEFPNIKVEIELQDGAEDPSILVRMAAGTAPDVIQTGEFNLKRRALASEGGFLDLTPFIEADQDFDPFTEYFDTVFNVGVIDGGVYAFDKDFATTAFYVNTDMFAEAGLEIPQEGWTYDDLISLARELTLDANGNNALSPDFDPSNIVQFGWWHATDWVRGWQPIAYSFGAQLLSDDGLTASGFLNSEETVKAVQLYQDAVHKYHIAPSVAAIEAQPGVDLFASGQVAIRGPHGPWQLTGYSENPDLDFATVPMPVGPSGRFSVICWAGFAVNKNSPHPEEAYQLVKYFATVGQNILVNHALTANVALSEASGRDKDPLWSAFVNEISNLHPLDDLKTAHWVECINKPLSNLLQSVQSPDGAGIDVSAELNAIAASADTCLQQPF